MAWLAAGRTRAASRMGALPAWTRRQAATGPVLELCKHASTLPPADLPSPTSSAEARCMHRYCLRKSWTRALQCG